MPEKLPAPLRILHLRLTRAGRELGAAVASRAGRYFHFSSRWLPGWWAWRPS